MHVPGWPRKLEVTGDGDGEGTVSRAEPAPLRQLADTTGLARPLHLVTAGQTVPAKDSDLYARQRHAPSLTRAGRLMCSKVVMDARTTTLANVRPCR